MNQVTVLLLVIMSLKIAKVCYRPGSTSSSDSESSVSDPFFALLAPFLGYIFFSFIGLVSLTNKSM